MKDDQNVQTSSGGPPILLFSGYRGCFSGVKWPGRETVHRPTSSAEINEWVFTSDHFNVNHSRENVLLYFGIFMGPFFLPSFLFPALFLPSKSLHHYFRKQKSVVNI